MAGRVRVLFIPHPGQAVPDGMPLLRRKKDLVWNNAGRNRLAAVLAAGLAKNARRTLRGLGVQPKDACLPDRVRQRVVVLAEVADQARRLAALLPGWAVLDAVPVTGDEAGWDGEPDPDDDPPPGKIVTLVHAARYGVGCDILVRATAGTGRLEWGSFRGGGNRRGTTPALLVDVADRAGGRERTDAAVRRREYREQRVREVTANPMSKSGAT